MAGSVLWKWCARETGSPDFTRAVAGRRLASVTRLAAPSWSSFPQRPQFEILLNSASNSARLVGERSVWAPPLRVAARARLRATGRHLIVTLLTPARILNPE